jgi:protein-arginine kinase activator protein McsA
MIVCDICKTRKATIDVKVTVDDNGAAEPLELCGLCWREFRYREDRAKHQAYEETVKAMTGELPRKSHWWDMFSW